MNKYLLHRFIEKHSAENAQRIAIAQGGVEVSYQELNELVNQLAHLLQQKGIQKGDPVGILLSSSIEYLGCLFAVMKIGAIAMPLDANYPENKLKNILADVHPRLLFSTEKNTDLLTAICRERQKDVVLLSYTEEGLALQENGQAIDVNSLGTENVTVDLDGTESCYLLFTSGSTSKPKGIEGVFKSLSHFIHWEAGMLALDEGVRVSQLAPISFDVSLRDVFLPILLGGRICIPGEQLKFQINEFIRWIQTSEIDVIHCVPSYFRLLIKAVKEDARLLTCLSSVKNILVAGEPLYGRDVNSWFDLMGDRVQLVNLYGPSETTLAKLFYKVPFQEYPPDAIIPLGKPISNASALIVSEGQMCVPGQKAEILLKTPFRTKGYYKNEELNKVKFVQNPLHNDFEDIVFCTGDIGSFDADGNVHFHGRTDDMVKYNGNRIELAEVQNVALKSEEIELAVAQIRMSSDEDQLLVLYYKSKSGLDQTNVLTQLYNANLPLYMHPALFVALDEVPRLPNGKVNKHALNDIPLPSHSAGEEITDELELEIAEIWKNLLNVSSLSRGQSFFQLGGTSLKAIQLISKIYKKKKVLLNLKSIFDQPTVGGIRQLIEAGAAPKDEAAGEKKKSSETSSGLSFTQEQLAHWIGSEQESADFNMPYVYTIAGPLDGPLSIKAVRQVMGSYDVLRQPSDGLQTLSDVVDMKGADSQKVADYIAKYIAAPFSKDDSPIKCHVVRVKEDAHLLVLLTHLTKMDGASVDLVFGEIQKAYALLQEGGNYRANSDLVSLDGATGISGLSQEAQQAFWKERFQLVERAERLVGTSPFDSRLLTYDRFVLERKKWEGLHAFAQKHETSIQIVLTAVFERALERLFQQSEVVYHSVISSRHRYEKSVLGNALYFIPFRTSKGEDLEGQLDRVKEQLFGALERLPFQMDAKYRRPDIVLNVVDARDDGKSSNGGGLQMEEYTHHRVTGRFPLSVTMTIQAERLLVDVSMLADLVGEFGNMEPAMKHTLEEFFISGYQKLLAQ